MKLLMIKLGCFLILVLIQIGGLGVITIISAVMILLNMRMGLGNRLLLQDAFNLNSLSGIVRFVKRVIQGTFLVEGIGAALYMLVFVPEFGAKGIWISVFTSISAFCNAGIDILAENREAGMYLAASRDMRQIFVTGHPEYDYDTLKNEYMRDLAKGINPSIPVNYFPDDNPENRPINYWKGHANLLYGNWLNYFVYQRTPFDLSELK